MLNFVLIWVQSNLCANSRLWAARILPGLSWEWGWALSSLGPCGTRPYQADAWELLSAGRDGQQGALRAGVEIWESLEFSALILLLVVWSAVPRCGEVGGGGVLPYPAEGSSGAFGVCCSRETGRGEAQAAGGMRT